MSGIERLVSHHDVMADTIHREFRPCYMLADRRPG